MTWGAFKKAVREFLTQDSVRKGHGIQKYIERQIRSGVRDLQVYIEELRVSDLVTFRNPETTIVEWDPAAAYPEYSLAKDPSTQRIYSAIRAIEGGEPLDFPYWMRANLVNLNAEGELHTGTLEGRSTAIQSAWIRRWPTEENQLHWSSYRPVEIVPWTLKEYILNKGKAGVTFGSTHFFLNPILRTDEKLIICMSSQWLPENAGSPLAVNPSDDNDEALVIFDEAEADAVADYVQAYLHRRMEQDEAAFGACMNTYMKKRQVIFLERKRNKPEDAINNAVGGNPIGQYPAPIP